MSPKQSGISREEIERIGGFALSHDNAGMKRWLHSVPLERVHCIHKQYGVEHPFSQIIKERYQMLLSESASKQPVKEGDHWYKKPIGVIVIGVTTFVIARAIYTAATQHFPQWFK